VSTTSSAVAVQDGLATLGSDALRIMDGLDALYRHWASLAGATRMLFPPLVRVDALDRIDYFHNFPHLGLAAAPLDESRFSELAASGLGSDRLLPGALGASRYMLPSAACYQIYNHHAGATIDAPLYVTTTARCYRNETTYDDLRRLWGFTMCEIVCLGEQDAVLDHLARFRQRVGDALETLGIGTAIEKAGDPFFDRRGAVAVLQALVPTKEEFVCGRVAVGSLNFHRNFFGERCEIRLGTGAPVFTGCVAFGVERWLWMLLDRFGGDADAACAGLASLHR
jgi:seryl-tRNA synthetase